MTDRLLAVWSRDPRREAEKSGQQGILSAMRHALDQVGRHDFVLQRTSFERRGLSHRIGFAGSLLRHMGALKPLPLQCALFSATDDLDPLFKDRRYGTFVFDGLRSLLAVERLRRLRPEARIIVQMDDLLSRRMDMLLRGDHGVSLGAFASRMPPIISSCLRARSLARGVLRYERLSLRCAEAKLLQLADVVVMVSDHEAAMLARSRPAGGRRAEILQLAPPAPQPAHVCPFDVGSKEIRYVFVGSDRLVQNRTTIDLLLEFWRSRISAPKLVIYGAQTRRYSSLPSNVLIAGPFESAEEVYDGRSVLLCPSVIAGGIKTKVLEAFACGAPVIGNALSFEGLQPSSAFLQLDKLGLDAVLAPGDELVSLLKISADAGRRLVSDVYSYQRYVTSWISILVDADGAIAPLP